MPVGTVGLNYGRGHGFSRPEDGTNDIFVQITAGEHAGNGQPAEGQGVQFDIEAVAPGPGAVDLRATE